MRPRSPSGPLRQSVNATNRPTTTGGSAMPVLTTLSTSPRLRNRDRASHVPSGNPMSRLSPVASPDTISDSSVIPMRSPPTKPPNTCCTWSASEAMIDRRYLLKRAVVLAGVRIEERQAVLVGAEDADDLLSGGPRDVVLERLRARRVDLRPFCRVHGDDAIDVDERGIALHEGLEAQLGLVGKEDGGVGQGVAALLRGDLKRRPHPLAGLKVPAAR